MGNVHGSSSTKHVANQLADNQAFVIAKRKTNKATERLADGQAINVAEREAFVGSLVFAVREPFASAVDEPQ